MSDEGTTPQWSEDPATGRDAGPALASEISRRVAAILDAVEGEASRLREQARADAARHLDDARRQADALVAERQQRIAAISDELVSKSEAVVARLEDAEPVRAGFESLVRALGDAAERLARETGGAPLPPAPPAFHETWVPAAPPPPAPAAQPDPAAGRPAPAVPAPGVHAPAGSPAQPYPPPVQAPVDLSPPEPPSRAPETPEAPPPREPEPPPSPSQPPGPEPPRFRPAQPGSSSPFTPRVPAAEAAPPATERPAPAREPGPSAQPWRQAEDSRLVAMQMAIAGSTRGEVRDHLAAVLGVVDSDRVLDGIFGPGGSPEQRLPGTGERR